MLSSLSGAVTAKWSRDVWKDKKHKIKCMGNELLQTKHEGCCWTIAKLLLRSQAWRNQKLRVASKAEAFLDRVLSWETFGLESIVDFNFTLMTRIHWGKMKLRSEIYCCAACPEWEQAVLINNHDTVIKCVLESLNMSVDSRHLSDVTEQENVI